MKTPREILLARHRAIEPKLDDIREDVIGKLNNEDPKTQSFSGALASCFLNCPETIWRELIWPARWIWTGLATVWILILAANFSMQSRPEIRMAKTPPSADMIMAFHQQEQLLSELIGANDPPAAQAPKTHSPRPASQRRTELLMT